MLGYPPPPPPPPPPWGAQGLTACRDPRFGSTKGGGDSPLQPPKRLHTPRDHTLAGSSPRATILMERLHLLKKIPVALDPPPPPRNLERVYGGTGDLTRGVGGLP